MGAITGPPFRDVDWEDNLGLEQYPAAKEEIEFGLSQALVWMVMHAKGHHLTVQTFSDTHRVAFQGVFPEFAGLFRGPDRLNISVTFGDLRAVPAEDVRSELEQLVERSLNLFRRLQDGEAAALDVLQVACYLHAELVRIHPFRNGNGRVARLFISYVACKFGYASTPVARPGQEDAYKAAIRAWVKGKHIDPLVEIFRPVWQKEP